jgi:hypothetical protein
MISRKALMIGFVGLVFVAGGTAGVLESFGTVSGTADVEEPVFYAQPDSSLMTEAPSDGNQQIYDGDGPSFVYESDSTWYPMDVSFDVEVRDDSSDDNNVDGKVNATFSVGDKSCEEQFTVSDTQEEYEIEEFSCSISERGTGNVELHLEQVQGKSYLNYDESTFVEVSAK